MAKTTITTTDIDTLMQYLTVTDKNSEPYLHVNDRVYFKHKKTNDKKIETKFGRVLFNSLLPEDYPFVDDVVNSSKLDSILDDILDKYGEKVYGDVVNKLQVYLGKLSTITSPTIDVSKLVLPDEIIEKKNKIVDELLSNEKFDPVEFDKKMKELYKEVEAYLKSKNATFYDLIDSGTKGKPDDIIQLFIAYGYVISPTGKLIPPIKSSLLDGMKPEDLYKGAEKARFAAFLKSTYAAGPGYMSRKMRFSLSNIHLADIDDCKTTKFLNIKISDKNKKSLLGRNVYENGKLIKLTNDNINDYVNTVVKLRSPVFCKAKDGICKICYGEIWKYGGSKEIGISASQNFYLRTLNFTMKFSHSKQSVEEMPTLMDLLEKHYE